MRDEIFRTTLCATTLNDIESLTENDIGKTNTIIRFTEKTPAIFQEFGFPDLPLIAYRDKIARALFLERTEKHGHSDSITKPMVKEIARTLADPFLIFRSTNGKDLVVIYDIPDRKGNPIMLSLRAEQKVKFIRMNIITSMYGRQIHQITNWIDNNLLLYADDSKSKNMAALNVRLQLPSIVTAFKSEASTDTAMPLKSMINVRYKSGFVNSKKTMKLSSITV